MTKFIKDIEEHIKTLALYAPLKLSRLDKTSKSIALRIAPSPSEFQLFDNSRRKTITLQILAKSDNQIEAIEALEIITDSISLLETKKAISRLIKAEMYSDINYVEMNSQNEYIYTVFYRFEIEK